jgi:hypothetical protein
MTRSDNESDTNREQPPEELETGSRAFLGSPPPDDPPSLEEIDKAIWSARRAAAKSPQLGDVAKTLQAVRDMSAEDFDTLRAAALTLERETQTGAWPPNTHDVAMRLVFHIEDVLRKAQGRGIHSPPQRPIE